MISVYQLKPAFQKLLMPIVVFLNNRGVSPNQVTLFTCMASILFSAFLLLNVESTWVLVSVWLFFFVRMAFNAIDGMLAKNFNQQTKLGSLLNEVTDVISDVCLYLALILHPDINIHMIYLFAIFAIITEFSGSICVQINAQRRFDGPMGKSDRAVVIGLLCLCLAFFNFSEMVYSVILGLSIVLMAVTIFNRLSKGLKTATV